MTMKRRITLLFLIFILLFTVYDITSANSAIQSNPKVYVNGGLIANAVSIDNVTYVPLNTFSAAVGADVKIDANTGDAQVNPALTANDMLIPSIIQTISPSVVGIIGNYETSVSSYSDKQITYTVFGSGVIIKSNGEILTNAHVVKGLKTIVVVLNDGSAYVARLKNIDEKSDLAVVKIDKVGLPIAKFASMDTVVTGKSVIAIGTPISFSLRNSASTGIISGINRGVYSEYALIQTDAAINPGNSGGPLVNMAGEVVGINSSKFAGVGVEGMGFSIPADTVLYVLSHFEKYGVVVRPEFGADFEESWASKMGLPTKDGLTIKRIKTNTAASKSGLKDGDIISSIDGVSISSIVDLNECLKKYMPGDSCKAVITRNSQVMSITITY